MLFSHDLNNYFKSQFNPSPFCDIFPYSPLNGSQYLEILVLNTQLRNIPNSQRKKKSNNYNNLGPFNIIFGSLNFEPKLHPNKTTCFYQLECRRLYPLSFSICFSKMSLIKKLYSLVDGSIKITHPHTKVTMILIVIISNP